MRPRTLTVLPLWLSLGARAYQIDTALEVATGNASSFIGLAGDIQCTEVIGYSFFSRFMLILRKLMCISVAINDSTASYVLQSTNAEILGWMAM